MLDTVVGGARPTYKNLAIAGGFWLHRPRGVYMGRFLSLLAAWIKLSPLLVALDPPYTRRGYLFLRLIGRHA